MTTRDYDNAVQHLITIGQFLEERDELEKDWALAIAAAVIELKRARLRLTKSTETHNDAR